MKKIFYLYLFITVSSLQFSQAQNKTKIVPLNSSNWQIDKGTSSFEIFDNRETLLLNGKAILKDTQFTNGTIEVDVYANSNRSFAGLVFRKQQNTMEEVYMRLHKSSQADAIQYSPTFNEELTWQLYKEYQANITFKTEGWNTLRIEIHGYNAVVFVNNEKVLTVDNLKTNHDKGELGLFALFNNRFSNFKLTPRYLIRQTIPNTQKHIAPNIISQWNITKAFSFNKDSLNFDNILKENYTTVSTDKSGLLPFSKYIEKPSAGNFEKNTEVYAIASTIIESNNNQVKLFSFDYSDKIIVFLNGTPIFKGNNAFRSKGIQYQGHIDINANKLYLNLKNGENTLHCVVIDKANGWGIIGKLE